MFLISKHYINNEYIFLIEAPLRTDTIRYMLIYKLHQKYLSHSWTTTPVLAGATDWMFVSPPQLIYWKPIPSVMAFEGGAFEEWWHHQGGALLNGVSALRNGLRELPPCFHHGQRQQEDGRPPITRRLDLNRHRICWRPDPGLPSLHNLRNKCLLYKSPSL